MGLGLARVVSLAEARAKANDARKLLAAGSLDRGPTRSTAFADVRFDAHYELKFDIAPRSERNQ
jgi:hypothetical protein